MVARAERHGLVVSLGIAIGLSRPADGCGYAEGRAALDFPIRAWVPPSARVDNHAGITMARGDVRIAITLACEECKHRNYQTNKSKRNNPDRVSLRKYCRWCRRHTSHRETR